MKEGPDIARIAALIGDPARANILTALMSGKALTVTELAGEAGVTVQTASSHLARLREGGLLRMRRQGRHSYLSLADEGVAQVLEGLMGLAARSGHTRLRTGPRDGALRDARLCYNHLAGTMGIRLYDSMVAQGWLVARGDGLTLSEQGAASMRALGLDIDALRRSRSPMCRECLDWSERRSHLAGSLGRALLARFEVMRWVRVDRATRVVTFQADGLRAFEKVFAG